jgi:hypothetical protein
MDIIGIYEEILSGKRKQFPLRTWEDDTICPLCLRHLSVKLGWTREDICNLTTKKMIKYRLKGALNVWYKGSTYAAVVHAFSELEIKPWEMARVPNEYWGDETMVEVLRWLFIDKLDYSREEIVRNASLPFFRNHGLGNIITSHRNIQDHSWGDHSIFRVIAYAFPEHNFKYEEFEREAYKRREYTKGVNRR